MFIDRFYFLSKENELDAILAGVTYSGGKKYKEGALPFRVLPQRGIEILYLTGVTVITGSSDSPKAMMMKVMAAKLGIKNVEPICRWRWVNDYLEMCFMKYTDFNNRKFKTVYVEGGRFAPNDPHIPRKGLVSCYEELFCEEALYILEEPDWGMSLREQAELACLIHDCAKHSGMQFIISSNSPALMSIKGSTVYDLDEIPPVPRRWADARELKRTLTESIKGKS